VSRSIQAGARSASIALIIVGIAGAGVAVEARLASSANEIQSLIEMAKTPEMPERRNLCLEIVRANPRPFAQFFCDGYEAIHRGLDDIADVALESALRERPDFALAPLLYGDAYREKGDFERAERYYRRSVEIQPQRSDARFSLGQLLMERGRRDDPKWFKEALEAFRQMTELDPQATDGWANMGNVLVEMGRLDDAVQLYEKALTKEPNDPYLHSNLAAVYARQGRDDLAEAAWKRALAANAGYGPAVVELAAHFGRSNRLADAIRTLEAGRDPVVAPPWGPRVRRNLAFAWLGLQESERAADLFEEAVRSGTDALSLLGRGHLLLSLGNAEQGRDYQARGAALDAEAARPFLEAWPASGVVLGAGAKDLRGPRATPSLVAFVLEGWSFADADAVKAQLLDPNLAGGRNYDTPPVAIEQVAAVYPEAAQEAGQEGQVLVLFSIDETGRVTNVKVESSNATQELEEAALTAARRWVFQPATRFGNPIQSTITVPFRFTRRRS